MSLKKHTNTKPKLKNHETKNREPDHILDGICDLFQMEILDSDEVFACNVCNDGFDTADKVKKGIEINHNDILSQINKTIAEEEESENAEAFLARFDDDGNLIG